MDSNEKLRRIIITIALIIVALLSIFVISPLVSNPEFHSQTIEILDSKKMQILGWSAGSVGAATLIAAAPGDFTTPLANQIMQLSSCFVIVIGAIFLEKILLTLTGYLAFTFLVPISCILFILYLQLNKDILKTISIKLGVFGLLIFIVVPVSVLISNAIENSSQIALNQSIEEITNESTDSQEEKEGWDAFTSKIQETLTNIGNGASNILKKGEQMLSNLMDTIAIAIVTSCVIPLVTLITFIWIVKIIFHVTLPTPNIKNSIKKIGFKKTKKEVS